MPTDEIENRNMGNNCCCSCNSDATPYTIEQFMNNNMMNTNMNNYGCDKDCEDFRMTRECMIKQIKCYQFAIIELGLYLDTHPDDDKALCLHRKYARELKELKDKYQKVYGPLTINYPCNKWRWLEEPWPWERGNF